MKMKAWIYACSLALLLGWGMIQRAYADCDPNTDPNCSCEPDTGSCYDVGDTSNPNYCDLSGEEVCCNPATQNCDRVTGGVPCCDPKDTSCNPSNACDPRAAPGDPILLFKVQVTDCYGCDDAMELCCTRGTPGCDPCSAFPIGSDGLLHVQYRHHLKPIATVSPIFIEVTSTGKVSVARGGPTLSLPCIAAGAVPDSNGHCYIPQPGCDPTKCTDPCQSCYPDASTSSGFTCKNDLSKCPNPCPPAKCGNDPRYPGYDSSCFDCIVPSDETPALGSMFKPAFTNPGQTTGGWSSDVECVLNQARCPPPTPTLQCTLPTN